MNAIICYYTNEVINMHKLTPKSNQLLRVVIGVIIQGYKKIPSADSDEPRSQVIHLVNLISIITNN
jgi:hypothetical protein